MVFNTQNFRKPKPFNKIFVLSLSKMASTSLNQALNQLGIPCLHYPKIMPQVAAYLQTKNKNCVMLDEIFEQYRALSDISINPVIEALDQNYPGSVFIILYRNKEEWLESGERHYKKRDIELAKPGKEKNREIMLFFRKLNFGCEHFDKEMFSKAYDNFYSRLDKYFVGREDFMKMNIINNKHGWTELCNFLGLEPPGIIFPHIKYG